jgi:hypothetical protein
MAVLSWHRDSIGIGGAGAILSDRGARGGAKMQQKVGLFSAPD